MRILKPEGYGQLRSDCLNADAEPASGHLPVLFESRCNRFGHVAGDGKAEALTVGDYGGVDADHFAVQIDQGSATVARVDRRIGLQKIIIGVDSPLSGRFLSFSQS